MKPLESICTIFADGDWIESKDQSTEGVRLIQTGNVGEGVFKDREAKARYISEATFKRLRCTEIVAGDCLISRLPDPVGRSCILPDIGERMITAVDCTIVRFDSHQMLPGFFNLFSQSHDYLNSLDAETSGTTRKRISRSKLGQALIPVPPLPEQQRIVGILDEAFAAIATAKANTEKNLTNARAVFESHANSLWRTEHAGWTRTELGKVADRVTVGHVGITSPYYRDSGVLFLRTQNVTAQGIDLSEAKYITQEFHDSLKKSQVQPGDVLLSRVISREVNCGRVPEDIGPANCANVVAVRPGAKLVPDFLVYYIRSTDAQAYLLSRKVGSAQLVVNTTVVKKWPIVVPPVAVQRELVARLNRLHAESQRLESLSQQKLAALDALKKSLLHQAFTGRLTDRSAGSVNV